jgi:DNA-binding HxlR family transcriptional regulator
VLSPESSPQRFGVLRRHLRPVSAKVLAETLVSRERDGLVCRRPVGATDDQGVEYELTPLGRSLLGVIEHVRGCAREHIPELAGARAAFDAESGARSA